MVIISINGIIQIPGVDYHLGETKIAFTQAPSRGSTITINSTSGVLSHVIGDGSTYLYDYHDSESVTTRQMLELAYLHRSIPAVADMLERLKVVVELAKQ